MKKMTSKIMALAAAAAMAACAPSAVMAEETTEAAEADSEILEAEDLADIIPEETVTLDVFDQLANYSGEQVGWFGQIMLDKFNVKLNIISQPDKSVYQTRMESGDLGDLVIWGSDGDDYLDAVSQDMLYDWNEDDLLANYGPYINAHMQAALEKNASLSEDGTVYGFGHAVASSSNDIQSFLYTWDLRFDLYEQLGCPEISNLDDLIEVLKQMKEICPTDDNGNPTYGVSLFNDWDGNMVMFVKSTASAYYGYDEFGFGLYDPDSNTYYPCLDEDGPYLEMLKFYNKLYQAGLVDPDSQTQGYDGMTEDYQNGTAFLNVFNFLGSALYNSETHLAEGKAMYPVMPSEAKPIVYGQSIYGGNRIWSIGANTEYPELCMAIINWLSTPEGVMTYNYGPKDVCWYYDEDGYTHFTDIGLAAKTDITTEMPDPYTGTFDDGSFKINNETWSTDSKNPDSNGETYNYRNWASYTSEAGSEIEQEWRDWSGADSQDEYFVNLGTYTIAPGTMYSEASHSDELQVEWDQVATCIKNGSWSAIYASTDEEYDEIVAQMISDAKSYGYDDCIAFQEEEAVRRSECEDAAEAAAAEE
ncbi:MAG: hypothetical protein ACOX8B_08890 [Lachnospiraceae bacterium]|jgi:putative aldouronate transport system substrate-binding protein